MEEDERLACHHRRAAEKRRLAAPDTGFAGRSRGLAGHYRAMIAVLTEHEARTLDGFRRDPFPSGADDANGVTDPPAAPPINRDP